MARTTLVMKPSDYPDKDDEAGKKILKELFEQMFPGQANPEIPGKSAAFGTVARIPGLARHLVDLSGFMVRECPWTSNRQDLKQLMIQTLNYHLKCDFCFLSHMQPAAALGLTLEQQASIPFWKTVNVFSDEQRLVIEYTFATVAGDVPDELFARVLKQYGEKEAVGLTVGIAWWSFWAMIINATRTDFDFGYGPKKA